jgi:hypothetical protein
MVILRHEFYIQVLEFNLLSKVIRILYNFTCHAKVGAVKSEFKVEDIKEKRAPKRLAILTRHSTISS